MSNSVFYKILRCFTNREPSNILKLLKKHFRPHFGIHVLYKDTYFCTILFEIVCFVAFIFLTVLLRDNWHTALYRLVYSLNIWLMITMISLVKMHLFFVPKYAQFKAAVGQTTWVCVHRGRKGVLQVWELLHCRVPAAGPELRWHWA